VRIVGISLAVSLALPLGARGARAANADSVVELPPAVVEIEGQQAEAALGTGTASVIEVASAPGNVKSVADVVAQAPGVNLRRTGTVGSYSMLSIRGLGPENVAVVLDDLPLSAATLGPIDLNQLPAAGIERLEVYRGSGPVRFASPLGGVVRLVTATPPDHFQAAAHIGYGAFATRSAHLALAGPAGPLRYSALVAYEGTQGDFRYYDDRDTLYNSDDDLYRRRQNNQFDGVHAHTVIDGEGPAQARLRLVADGLWHSQGVPGTGVQQTTATNTTEDGLSLRLSEEGAQLLDGKLTLTTAADAFIAQRHFRNPKLEYWPQVTDTNSQVARLGADARLVALESLANETEVAPRLEVDRFRQDLLGNSAAGEGLARSRVTASVGVEHRMDLTSGLRLVPSVRLEAAHDEGQSAAHGWSSPQASPRLGLLWTWRPCELRANAGRFHRLPSLLERFGDGIAVDASPDVAPEFGVSADLGVGCEGEPAEAVHARLEVAGFATAAQHLIVFAQNGQGRLLAKNLGATHIAGIETAAKAHEGFVAADATYTLTRTRDVSGTPGTSGKQAPGIPGQRAAFGLELGPEWASVRYDLSWSTQMYLDSANLNRVPPRLLHDASARLALGKTGFELRLTVTNLTNESRERRTLPAGRVGYASLMDFLGYPLPGRAWFLTCTWRR
jgi:vitamin B12 transporter